MTRGWKITVGIVAAVVAFNLLLRLLGSFTGGTPGGPNGSSYATARRGVAAYATLLGRTHHEVDAVRDLPHKAKLGASDTVMVLDPPFVAKRDALALRDFAQRGGRVVAAGNAGWLRYVLPEAPSGTVSGPRVVHARGLTLLTNGRLWKPRSFAITRRIGSGTLAALADASPLENRLLDRRDNAAFALDLAGDSRRVVFLESYHGYGHSNGLAALPLAWKLLLPGLALAVLVYMLARGRRFGPPERADRELPPPRREYVDSLAAVLARTGPPEAALRSAAKRAGLDDDDTAALLARVGQDPR